MTISRRNFQLMALTTLAASGLPSFASSRPNDEDIVLNRLTFGATSVDRKLLSQMGLSKWLDEQLTAPIEDDALSDRLHNARLLIEYDAGRDNEKNSWQARKERAPYKYLEATPPALLPLIDYENHGMHYEERIRPAREVQAAALIRAVHAKAQLREVITQFWHDHFNVNSMRDEHTGAFFGQYDRSLREYALGNFRNLLGIATKSPSMLFYLNNDASRASPANENFARELFELHTFGAEHYANAEVTKWQDVPGANEGLANAYIDQDVYEAARAFTGWSFGDGRWISEGENAPKTGEFHYINRWHDPYQKRILGVEFDANAGPMEDGERLLDLLADHPSTARFVCKKLCRRLVADEPKDSLVDQVVGVWLANLKAPDQIAKTIRAIVMAPEFLTEKPEKIKRPFEFLTSLLRAVDADVKEPSLSYVWLLSRAGWHQHEYRPPTGHADVSDHWANTATLATYADLALNALEEWSEISNIDVTKISDLESVTQRDMCRDIVAKFAATGIDELAASILSALELDPQAPVPSTVEERAWQVRGIVAMAALSPHFLFR